MNATDTSNKETQYRIMSDIEHVLARPGLYVGNTFTLMTKHNLYKPSTGRIVSYDNVPMNDAVLKFFDEIITNSVDEARRKTRLFDVTRISVEVYKNGTICISDNGGIPVKKHKEYDMYIPYMIFGVLRSSSNYNEERDGAGLNGLGAKLTNIFSKKFRVTTCDGKKYFDCLWSDNMGNVTTPVVKTVNGAAAQIKQYFPDGHGTRIEFSLDMSRLDMEEFNAGIIRVLQKRCIDAAASNIGISVSFKTDIGEGKLDSKWKFDDFAEYAKLYMTDYQRNNHFDNYEVATLNTRVVICPVDEQCPVNTLAFVNGAMCNRGTHIEKLYGQIAKRLLEILRKKDIDMVTEKDVQQNVVLFANVNLANPIYDSQVKTKLDNKLGEADCALSKLFLDKLEKSEIVNVLVDFYKTKYEAARKKELRKLNQTLKNTRSKKLITCAVSNPAVNEFWCFEGNSASNGFRFFRNPQTQAGYLLRGKIRNIIGLTKAQIVENVELREIIAALGLVFNDPEKNVKNCKFRKIVICSDMDSDGDHISGLFLVFFGILFPELIRAGYVYRALSPIVIATKNDENIPDIYYYSLEDYEKEASKLKGYEIIYCKGLGGLRDKDYAQMLCQQKLIQFQFSDADREQLMVWFEKATDQRKELLLADGIATTDED